MALRIFQNDPETEQKPRQSFADDIVGRFRSGYVLDDRPQTLDNWRVTTGDPDVANTVYDLLGGDAPQEWEAKGEDNLEVFTASSEVKILLGKGAIRQKMALWGRNGKPIYFSDGETILYPEDRKGEPDPDAHLTFAERKQRAKDGIGAEPQVEIFFRLADEPDLGIFKFQSSSWSLVSDLDHFGIEEELEDLAADSETGQVKATLKIEEVSFTAKNGPRAGKLVQYKKPVLKLKGAA